MMQSVFKWKKIWPFFFRGSYRKIWRNPDVVGKEWDLGRGSQSFEFFFVFFGGSW